MSPVAPVVPVEPVAPVEPVSPVDPVGLRGSEPPVAAVLLEAEADALVYLPTPLGTHAIGQSYRDFPK